MEFVDVAHEELYSLEVVDVPDGSASAVPLDVIYIRRDYIYTKGLYIYEGKMLTKIKEMVYVTNGMSTRKEIRR